MIFLGILCSGRSAFMSLLLVWTLSTPLTLSMPSNNSDSTKDTNRPSLELNFTNKLVKIEGNIRSPEQGNGTSSVTKPALAGNSNVVLASQVLSTKENNTNRKEGLAETQLAQSTQSTAGPNVKTTPWLPYYFSSEAIGRAIPPIVPDGDLIREGEAASSRGRSGSPRSIESFPTLQNQPGREYLDAISRRTVVPLPPGTTTTIAAKFTTANPPSTRSTPSNSTTPTTNKPLGIHKGEVSAVNADKSISKMANLSFVSTESADITTVENEPDIGTAFSLSEDFIQGFLSFPGGAVISDADLITQTASPVPKHTTVESTRSTTVSTTTTNTTRIPSTSRITTTTTATTTSPAITIRSDTTPLTVTRYNPNDDNFIETTPKANPSVTITTLPSIVASTTKVPSPNNVTKLNDTKDFIVEMARNNNSTRSSMDVLKTDEAATVLPVQVTSAKQESKSSTPTTTVLPVSSTTTTSTTPTTIGTKQNTKRPYLRRRLPSFRATSPRPTIGRRLSHPQTTTETQFIRTTTTKLYIPPIHTTPSEEVAPETTTPFVPPLEPTTTRREYIMTVPPLLDFENVARDDIVEEHVDQSLEATQLTSNKGGSIIPEGATNAIIISGIIGGCAILFFAVLMIFCMWRQHVSRRPIYPPPESSNSSSTSSTAFHGKMG